MCTGSGHTDLLAKDGPNGKFGAIDVPRRSAARVLFYERLEHGICTERFGDRNRICIQIEEPTTPLHRCGKVAWVGKLQIAINMIRGRRERNDAVPVR